MAMHVQLNKNKFQWTQNHVWPLNRKILMWRFRGHNYVIHTIHPFDVNCKFMECSVHILRSLVINKTFTENWACKQRFSVLIKKFRARTFLFFKIASWNFQHLFENKFRGLTNFHLNQSTDTKNENNNCLNQLNELKLCEVSRN